MIKIRNLPLTNFEKSFFSQWGEDGILLHIFSLIDVNPENSFLIDVGAWDGEYLSNTKHFIDMGWGAILIESNVDRARNASSKFSENLKVSVLNVKIDNTQRLSSLIPNTLSEKKCALLSIDIDSDDLLVFESIDDLRPYIVVIEFNPTIPNQIYFKNPVGSRVGNSARAIMQIANTFGYGLAHATQTNLILLKSELFEPTGIEELTLETALDDSLTVRGVFAGYDGSLHIIGLTEVEFPWHGLSRKIESLALPKALQKHMDEYNFSQRLLYRYFWFRQYWKNALLRRLDIRNTNFTKDGNQ